MSLSASPVILSCPMVVQGYVLRRQRTLKLRSHSLLVTGNVQIKRRSISMFGNVDSLAYSNDFELYLEVRFFQITSICTYTYVTLVVELNDYGDCHNSVL